MGQPSDPVSGLRN